VNLRTTFPWSWSLVLLFVWPLGLGGQSTPSVADDAKGTRVWIRQVGSSASDVAYGVSVDSRGDISIAGATEGSLDGTNAGESDAFVTKFAANGTLLWTRQLGSAARDTAGGVGTDGKENTFIAGYTFGGLQGTNAGDYDAFVAKYDPNGNRLWIRQIGTAVGDQAGSVGIDNRGNVYIAGDTFGSLDGANAGAANAYLAKFDPDGHRLWTRQVGSAAGDVATGISTDHNGNVYIAGQTDGSLDGANAGQSDAFLAKFDPSGTHLWTRQMGSASLDYANGISVDGNGNVFVTGITDGSLGGANAGGDDAFVARYDPDGNRVWVRQLGSSADDSANDISADGSGHVSVAGHTGGSLAGANAGGFDAFLASFDPDGTRRWIGQLGNGSADTARGVSADGTGNVYIAGQTDGNLDGTNAGEFDVFLAKYTSG
jgi:hypothetical protein